MRFPLQITLFAIFTLVVSATAGAVAWYGYRSHSDVAVDSAEALIIEVSGKIEERVSSLYRPMIDAAVFLSGLDDLSQSPSVAPHPLTGTMLDILDNLPQVSSVYFGYIDGQSYHVVSVGGREGARPEDLGAPENTRYALRWIYTGRDKVRYSMWRFLDAGRVMVASRFDADEAYDARKRIWFKEGLANEGIVRTDLYPFYTQNLIGFTVARRFDGPIPGVFGIDITIEALSEFLADQRFGDDSRAFMFDPQGQFTGFYRPDVVMYGVEDAETGNRRAVKIQDTNHQLFNVIYYISRAMQDMSPETIRVSDGVRDYIGRITPMETGLGKIEYLVAMVPMEVILGDIVRSGQITLIISIMILILSLPIVLLVARTVAKPLGRLSQETARIRSFDLEGEVGIKSYVREIDDLVQSVATMKTGLRSFGSYVPKSLVGQIVKSEITPEIGGERRNMTVMFTDIVGFTTVSESVSAEDLAVGLSDYFQDVGSVVLAEHGTIDKFIGDSVMAFWNAPLPADNHPALACRAAILACGAAAAGNVSRQEKGLPVFQTRFGLNTGDTIVGNIGSQERMDYTVIGGPVNMAARLEGLNKAYGTTVLISNSVRDGLGAEFLVRSMDVALPKGAVTPIEVFELMGMAVAPAEPETPDAAVEVAPDAEASTDTPDSASTLEGTSPEYRMAGQQCLLRILPLLPIWEQMIAAYRDARFADCAALLAQMEAVVPEDGPTRLYRSRVDALLANPPGPDWTPLTEFLSK